MGKERQRTVLHLAHWGASKEKPPAFRLAGWQELHFSAHSPRTSKIFPVYNWEWESAMDSKSYFHFLPGTKPPQENHHLMAGENRIAIYASV